MKIAVIGGDRRALRAAREFCLAGAECRIFGLELPSNDDSEDFAEGRRPTSCRLSEATKGAQALLLPVPVTRDGANVSMPHSEQTLPLTALAQAIPRECVVFGGGIPPLLCDRFDCRDLLFDGEFAAQNALPTAECALALAVLCHKGVLCGSRCALLGYGRIGRLLARRLSLLGAEVCVYARREEIRAEAAAKGLSALPFSALDGTVGSYDCIFNTVPAAVIDEKTAAQTKKNGLYIELASPPCGMTPEARAALACAYEEAPGLPGKYCPDYAGKILAQRVLALLPERLRPDGAHV